MSSIANFLTAVQSWLKDSIFTVFVDPRVAIGLSLLLLAAGIAFVAILIFFKWLPHSRKLKKLELQVRKIPDELRFVGEYLRIDEAIGKVKFVRHGWEEFKETLVLPDDGTNDPIYNTARPSQYINIAEAETSGLHLKIFQAIPNYFVGIGLLFTFLGLVAAIFFASEGISEGADIKQTQASLQKLLSAATFKFLTSIAGIMSSLMVGITYRVVAGKLQTRFDCLCEALEQRLAFATAESIAFDQLTELQKQTEQLERFNTDLAFSIAKELNSRLGSTLDSSLEKAMAPLAATMANMADRFGEMNQDAMSSMVDNFTNSLQQSAGAEMNALAGSLAETKESLGTLVSSLQSSGSHLNQSVSNAGHHLQVAAAAVEESIKTGLSESTTELRDQMESIAANFHAQFKQSTGAFSGAIDGVSRRAGEIFKPVQENLETLTGKLGNFSSSLDSQIESIGSLNRELGTLVQNTGAASTRLENAGTPIQQASTAIDSAAKKIVETSQSTITVQQNLAALAESVRGAVDETTRHWGSYAKRFEQVDQDLANTFKEFTEGAAKQQASVREFVSGVDKELDKALRNLAAGVENIQDSMEDFTTAVETLGATMGRE